jgi:hypothetical protein
MGARLIGFDRLRAKLANLSDADREALRPAVQETATEVVAKASAAAPPSFDITHETSEDGLRAKVGTNDYRAGWREFGTKGHTIAPKNRKALKFAGDAGDVFVGKVYHPGQPAKPFLFPAFESERTAHVARVAKALNRSHRKVAGR